MNISVSIRSSISQDKKTAGLETSPEFPSSNMIFKSALDTLGTAELENQFAILRKDLNINLTRSKNSSLPVIKPDVMSYALMFSTFYRLQSNATSHLNRSKADLKSLKLKPVCQTISLLEILNCIQQAELIDESQQKKLESLLELEMQLRKRYSKYPSRYTGSITSNSYNRFTRSSYNFIQI